MSRKYVLKKAASMSAAALLLAAALAGCAGESNGQGDASQPYDMSGQEAGNSSETDGSSGTQQTTSPESPGSGDEENSAGMGSDVQGEQETPSPEPPQPSAEPFVDKLTEEGIGWGLSFGESGTQPIGNASREELAQYGAYFMGDNSDMVIYLTFDCGYENGNTEAILDALKAHNAKATFFVVGHFLETAPELVKRMAEEGHAVGNHTYHHYDIDTLDEATFEEELTAVEEKFLEVTGTELSHYYRPPEGKCGITNLKRAQALGYNAIFWSLAYVDWDTENQPTHEAALDKLTSRIHPGAIVLLHNTSSTNGEILDELLTKWEEMGYTFQPLENLTR